MITFLYGDYGTGKTHSVLQCIKKNTNEGIHTFLIVPEQEAVQSERSTLIELPNSAQLNLEVLSFSRLYNRICREYGGLSYKYITKPIRYLLMWQNLKELSPLLEEFTNISDKDSSLCDVMLSAISECKASMITPAMLENTAEKIGKDAPLSKRLRDLALIYASYDRLISESYSDSSDDISRLYEVLRKEDFFKNCDVYIDSFTSFTAAEHKVIEEIFSSARNVTVTIPLPQPKYTDISVKSIKASEERLIRSADRCGGHRDIILRDNKRTFSPTLAYVAKNLWNLNVSQDAGKVSNDGSITMEICDTPYAEAEAASNLILELLRNGERCKDMLVLMRSPENYKGIIEPAFEKNGIPYYFSEKTDLNSLPPVKLLFSALRIMIYDWQKSDIISHIKTGLYSFSLRDCDLFEDYINTWNLHGKRFYETDGWTMNPDGYTERISDRGRDILRAANNVRMELTSILEKFFIELKAAEHIPDMCRAVYSYFTAISLETRMSELAEFEASLGNIKKARELKAIYKVMLDTLSDIATALPDTEADVSEFVLILKTVFNETDIGTIPTSIDEVTIGSAATLRAAAPKYTFILGLSEGEFPKTVKESGLFSSTDRTALFDMGLTLSSDIDTRSSDELMYARRAFATPSNGLYLFTPSAEFNGRAKSPSIPFNRVLALLKDYEPHRFSGNDLYYSVGAPKSAVAHIKALQSSKEGKALEDALSAHIKDINRISSLPISLSNITLTGETVDLALGKVKNFSSTKFESYVKCPFSFYCTDILKLREKKTSDFLSSDMGNFVHTILEKLVGYAAVPDKNGNLPTDEEVIAKTEKEVADYIDRISPNELKRSPKLLHIYKRLKDLALLMVRNIATEFSQSDFTPEFFELSIDGKGDNPPLMEFVHKDGSRITFTGKIDRVDVYRAESGKIYIRVIDYKTGFKKFSLDDVEHGINTQMLLYLFMLCKTPNTKFSEKLGLKDGESPLPAGVMYLSANVPTIQELTHTNDSDIQTKAEGELKRSGLILGDEEILTAMNNELSRKFLAGAYRKKSGEIVGDALTSAEGFEELYKQISDTVLTITKELRRGKAGATPLKYGKNDPCEYCKMKPVCRKNV